MQQTPPWHAPRLFSADAKVLTKSSSFTTAQGNRHETPPTRSVTGPDLRAGGLRPGPEAAEKDKTWRVTILHTNDHHGHFWQNSDGEYGMAARKTVVDEIRREVAAQGGYSLLLDGGDVNTGVPESA